MPSREHETFVELEFELADSSYPAIQVSQAQGCHFELLDAIRSDSRTTTAFFHVTGGSPDEIVEQGRESEFASEITVIEQYNDECIVKMTLQRSLFETLADAQIPLHSLNVFEGSAHFAATIPPDQAPEEIISLVKQNHPDVDLTKKHRTSIVAPFITQRAFQTVLEERLTDRQWTALSHSFEYGYFERPRRTTQRDLAERMGISPSTFGQHLHTALCKLLATFFDARSAESSLAHD